MNLFARILSHGFALVVVAILALGLIYRGDLFPDLELPEFLVFESGTDSDSDTASGEQPVQSSMQTQEMDAGEAPVAEIGQVDAGEPQPGDAPDAGDKSSEQPAAGTGPAAPAMDHKAAVAEDTDAADSIPEPVTRTIGDAVKDTPPVATDDRVSVDEGPAADAETRGYDMAGSPDIPAAAGSRSKPASTTAVNAAQATAAADSTAVPTPEGTAKTTDIPGQDSASQVGAQPAPVPDTSEIKRPAKAAIDKPAGTPYQLLAAAREAYWLRDYANAEKNYQALIASDPDNPDGYGELGNMYFSQGKWTLASASYFEAGKRLADEGLVDQARQLVDVLRGLQSPRSGELEQYITQTAPENP